jgi:hypothetical protein
MLRVNFDDKADYKKKLMIRVIYLKINYLMIIIYKDLKLDFDRGWLIFGTETSSFFLLFQY